METKTQSLSTAMGIATENELFIYCIKLSLNATSCSDILKKLICSHLTTNEMMYCAFLCGKMQEIDENKISSLFLQELSNQKSNQSK